MPQRAQTVSTRGGVTASRQYSGRLAVLEGHRMPDRCSGVEVDQSPALCTGGARDGCTARGAVAAPHRVERLEVPVDEAALVYMGQALGERRHHRNEGRDVHTLLHRDMSAAVWRRSGVVRCAPARAPPAGFAPQPA